MNAADTASAPQWTIEEMTTRQHAVLEQLAQEIKGTVAVGVVSARDRRVLAHRTPDAFSPQQLGEALYVLAGSAIDGTAELGGEDLFGVVSDGMVLTESAAIHYRVVGADRAIIVVTDLPHESAHLEIARRVIAAYDDVVLADV